MIIAKTIADPSLVVEDRDEDLILQMKEAFEMIESSLGEELKKSTELQAQSIAAALAMPSDSIY